MKNRWIYVLAIISIAAITFFLVNQQSQGFNAQIELPRSIEGQMVGLLKENLILNNQINGIKLKVEAEDVFGNIVSLKELEAKKPKLVFFYSELTCDVCVDQSFEYLNSFIEKAGAANAIVLVESKNLAYVSTLVRLNQIKTQNVFRVNKKNIDVQNKAFFFLLDDSKILHHTFFPMKEIPEVTDAYFSNLDRIFKQNPNNI